MLSTNANAFFSSRRTRRRAIPSFLLVSILLTGMATSAFDTSNVALPTGVSEKRLITQVLWQGVRDLPVGKRPRVILVMGGGGARGLCHIGVLRVLEEEKIPIDQIVGVSVGALIGSLYAAGLPVNHIESMAKEVGWDKLTDMSKINMVKLMLADVLLSTANMESYLNEHIGSKTFQDLNIPFSCTATDLRTGERVVFKEGPVAIAARASATIPAIFRPVQYRQRSLVDGGLVDNLPTDLASAEEGDIVIGVLPIAEMANGDVTSVFKGLLRAIEIQRDAIIDRKKKGADFLIEPNVGSLTLLDLGRYQECIEAGTIATRKSVLDLKKIIINRVYERREARGE